MERGEYSNSPCLHSLSSVVSLCLTEDNTVLPGRVTDDTTCITELDQNGTPVGQPRQTRIEPWQIVSLRRNEIAVSHCSFGRQNDIRLSTGNRTETPFVKGSRAFCPFITSDNETNVYLILSAIFKHSMLYFQTRIQLFFRTCTIPHSCFAKYLQSFLGTKLTERVHLCIKILSFNAF